MTQMFQLLRSASECQWTWSKGRKKAGKEKPQEKCARRKVSATCSACAACVGKGLQSHAHWQGGISGLFLPKGNTMYLLFQTSED